MIITLTPKTNKAKARVEQWGNKWEVRGEYNNRFCLVAVGDNSEGIPNSIRWIDKDNDPDFDWEKDVYGQ